MTGERGSTLLPTLVIGFAVVVLVGQSLVTIGRLGAAATEAEEAAAHAATWAARHGDVSDAREVAQRMAPDAIAGVEETSDGIAVTVALDVSLVGPEGSPLTWTVIGRAVVPVSEFRSQP